MPARRKRRSPFLKDKGISSPSRRRCCCDEHNITGTDEHGEMSAKDCPNGHGTVYSMPPGGTRWPTGGHLIVPKGFDWNRPTAALVRATAKLPRTPKRGLKCPSCQVHGLWRRRR